ncbi:hypothetical protein EK21DRAFT_111174 [Setomelanomma holmii]|uniref:Putative gamma-glutamylcyclotransferase n=1 Tax=Setomelanomma holmii TaxID=210430 RepID=A0A9P4HCD9_9PLEO|nr:hypothetical protein EK21DRAFT_111174 [Setomelanomma holmii]
MEGATQSKLPNGKSTCNAVDVRPASPKDEDDYFTAKSSAEPVCTEIDPEHARLYCLALNNLWPRSELYRQIVPTPPVFVYCSLMLPWVMAQVLGANTEQTTTYMTPAILRNYSRATVKYAELPTIVRRRAGSTASDKDDIQGMLLGSPRDWALGRIEEYTALDNHERDVVEVEVTTDNGEKIVVAAYAHVWVGNSILLEDKIWDPVEYMKSSQQRRQS